MAATRTHDDGHETAAGPGWADRADTTLRRVGYRAGGARRRVVDLLSRQRCLMSAKTVARALEDEGHPVGVASVYRALELLASLDLLERHEIEGVAHFEPADASRHHHHVVCGDCGRISSFEDAGLEATLHDLAGRLTHEIDQHDVLLHGRCAGCAAAAGQRDAR